MRGAIYVEGSANNKLAGSKPIDATYAAIKNTCSPTCPLKKDKLCYATLSFVGMINRRMERRAKNNSPLEAARAEAKAIDASHNGGNIPAGRFLRLHVSGDSRTIAGTRVLNNAVKRWISRGGHTAYSYTHSWAHVPRSMWSKVSVLASIENVDQVRAVRAQGYAPALVVPNHLSDKAYTLPNCDTKFIPCPSQTRGIGCSDCRLCFDADRLYKGNYGIAFAAHGVKKNALKRSLTVIQ